MNPNTIKSFFATIGIGTCVFWGIGEYRARVALQEQIRRAAEVRLHEQDADQQREQAERSFKLSDAYKQPPFSYVEGREARLFGRISPIAGENSIWGGVTAQDLDAKSRADNSFNERCSQAQAAKARAVANFAEFMWRFSSEIPRLDARDEYEGAEAARTAIAEHSAKICEPKRQDLVRAAFAERAARFAALAAEHRLVSLARDVRVRVLDISGHYAKVAVVDGDHAGQTVFMSPTELLTK